MQINRIAGAMALLLMLAAGCGRGSESGRDSDSLTDSMAVEEIAAADTVLYLCADSIYSSAGGSLRVGTSVRNVPSAIEGLYDAVEHAPGVDAEELRFKLGDEYLFTALDFGEGKVDMIMANNASVRAVVAGAETEVTLLSPFSEVLALPGVAPEWCGLDDTGMWYWTASGLWFAPSQEHLTPGLSQRLYNEDNMPVAGDFTPEVTTGYIGTGVPF